MTEPLVPADVDLRDFAFMPLDVVRLRDSDLAAIASGDAFRAAVLLWCASWHQMPASSLPSDDRLLASLSGYGRDLDSWLAVKEDALRGFVLCSDGRLYHHLIAKKATEAWAAKQKQRSRAIAGAAARWGTHANDTHANATTNTKRNASSIPEAHAEALQQECQGTGIGIGTEKESSLRSLSTREIDAFADEFLEAYPKPEEPYAAREKFIEIVRSGVDPRTIVDAAKAYAEERKGQEPRWTKKPAKWLEAGGYVRAKPAAPSGPVSEGVYVEIETPQWAAWEQHYRATKGRGPPTDKAGKGWFFPTEWPPNARAEHAA